LCASAFAVLSLCVTGRLSRAASFVTIPAHILRGNDVKE
jgi:hypothetical protein